MPGVELYMEQVIDFVNGQFGDFFREVGLPPLTKSMVNNYVKAKIVEAPVKKRYSKLSLAMIIVIYLLKTCYNMDEIEHLIAYGISLDSDLGKTYEMFCDAMEAAINGVFAGEVHIQRGREPGRNKRYLMANFAQSFASKFYVQRNFINRKKSVV